MLCKPSRDRLFSFIVLACLVLLGCEPMHTNQYSSQKRLAIVQKMVATASDDYERGKVVLEFAESNPAKSFEEQKNLRDNLIQAKHYLDRAKSVYLLVLRQDDLEASIMNEDMPRRRIEARVAIIDDMLLRVQKKIVE